MATRYVLEAFAGPGGWSTGLRMLDLPHHRGVGFEWNRAACETAKAAGHVRVRSDVTRVSLEDLVGAWLVIMSPSCQPWTKAGRRMAALDLGAIIAHTARVMADNQWVSYEDAGPLGAGGGDQGGTWHDSRSPMVLEVLRWIIQARPLNIALEQVPEVLPYWRIIGRWLESLGYTVWTGLLSSERYGVPQCRERAILIASTTGMVSPPPATHTAYEQTLRDGGRWHGTGDALFGGSLSPWRSMADAIGLPPGCIVRTRGNRRPGGGNDFSADRPAWALTSKARSWTLYGPDGRELPRLTASQAGVLQSFPADYPWSGSMTSQFERVGDAVPPLMAAHVLASLLGVESPASLAVAA